MEERAQTSVIENETPFKQKAGREKSGWGGRGSGELA